MFISSSFLVSLALVVFALDVSTVFTQLSSDDGEKLRKVMERVKVLMGGYSSIAPNAFSACF